MDWPTRAAKESPTPTQSRPEYRTNGVAAAAAGWVAVEAGCRKSGTPTANISVRWSRMKDEGLERRLIGVGASPLGEVLGSLDTGVERLLVASAMFFGSTLVLASRPAGFIIASIKVVQVGEIS